MIALVIDTHVLIWFVTKSARLSAAAIGAIQQVGTSAGLLGVSSISLIEMVYLVEKGRLPQEVWDRVNEEFLLQPDLLRIIPLSEQIARDVQRVPRDAVPDMPDRIIAATALHFGVPLVSRDRKIRLSQVQTVW